MIVEALMFLQLASAAGDFEIAATKVPVGTLYHYRKSNIDGTSASNVLLYIATEERIESLKWTAGKNAGTWIIADMDWDRFSVASMRNWRLRADSEPVLIGRLESKPDSSSYEFEFGTNQGEVTVNGFPWHSYDFDFSSLNVTLRFLSNPEKGFEFNVADAIPIGESWIFGEVGRVNAKYAGEEMRHGYLCNRYVVDGPGLKYRGGSLWVSKTGSHVVDLEIALPDEDKYENNKLRLLSVASISADEWQATVRSAWRGPQ